MFQIQQGSIKMETESNSLRNTKRIAKNTVVLYARSVVVMLIALYTSRVVLSALGVSDYGLYNVVGGVVGLFAFLRSSMEKCTQRFLNFGMATTPDKLTDIFRVSFTIHVAIAVATLLLAETIGLWYLNTHVQIPDGRLFAANCVYQSTVLGLVFTILTIPLSASIIAHERMGFFALVSIVDAFLKLGIAFLVVFSSFDHLIYYASLILCVQLINLVMYVVYCSRNFEEVSFKPLGERKLAKKMLSYVGWALFGHSCIIATNQGNILLVNQFFGVIVNAAMAVASQVNSAVLSFTGNFQTAFNPQITKSYAAKDFVYLKSLVYGTTKISFFLLTTLSLPLMFNMEFILGIWLKEVPEYAAIFCILMLTSGILQASTSPLNFCIMSSGDIKWFQITTGLVFLSDLFIVYALFSIGFPAIYVMIVKILIMIGVCIVRLVFANKIVSCINAISYLKEIVCPLLLSTACSILFSFGINKFVHSPIMHCISIIAIAIATLFFAYMIGLSSGERELVKEHMSKTSKRLKFL